MSLKMSLSFPTFKILSTLFLLLALCVMLVIMVSTVGSVEVQVKPTVFTRVVDSFFTLTASLDAEPGSIRADFQSVQIKGVAPIESAGGVVRPQKARYAVVVHNQYSRDQSLVRTTRFLYNDSLYRLVDPLTVRAGGSARAVVEADQEGAEFARSKGEKLTIPGLWAGIQPYIFGIVDEELRPGFVTVREASQEQIDAATIAAFKDLEVRRSGLLQGDTTQFVLHQANEPVSQEIPPGAITVTEVVVEQTLRTIAFSKHQFEGVIRETLASVEPEKRFLYDAADIQFEITEWEDNSARLKVTIPVQFFSPLDPDHFQPVDFRGKSEESIFGLLQERYGVTEATVNYSPRWLKWFLSRFGAVTVTLLDP